MKDQEVLNDNGLAQHDNCVGSHLGAPLDEHLRRPLDEQPIVGLVSSCSAEHRHGLAVAAAVGQQRSDRKAHNPGSDVWEGT